MKPIVLSLGLLLLLLSSSCASKKTSVSAVGPRLEHLADFPSKHVLARHVDVWLPPGYDPQAKAGYQVLYMHDGQNLFDAATAGYGVEWGIDEALLKLMASGEVAPTIVVGVWNTPRRFMEYAPNKPLAFTPDTFRVRRQEEFKVEQSFSDEYLRFLVTELKPYIDSAYHTRPDRAHTFVMGSSMGGLISLYALLEYPSVFGGAGCVSTHWPLSLRYNDQTFTTAMLKYMDAQLPRSNKPRIYFDYGTATLDALYEPSQVRVDSLMRAKGYTHKHWMSQKFEGAEHNEKAWQQRVHIPLSFLLNQ